MSVIDEHNQEVTHLAAALVGCERLADQNPLTVERQKNSRLIIASAPSRRDITTHLETGSFAERIAIADARAYTLRLVDDTLIQLMWTYEGKRLVKHRFAWLPAPLPPVRDSLEAELTPEERLGGSLASMGHLLRLGGSLRIDHDLDAASARHPATHLTLFGPGMEEGRLPIRGPWCLGRFCRFLFGQLAPPSVEGQRTIELTHQKALIEAVSITSAGLDIDAEHMQSAWLAWGPTASSPASRVPRTNDRHDRARGGRRSDADHRA
ncbi:MAG: DUF2290 domain-containing protein [Nannocystis sp.]|nr:DUF2290 domain-containing protein [Nannocystis sp.]